jgi:uncharacterized protein
MIDENSALEKKKRLLKYLEELGSIVIAFSGGVDSTFLLALAHEAVGEKALAVTSNSKIHPARETEAAISFTGDRNIRHILFSSGELALKEFIINGTDRCYHCKRSLFENITDIARKEKIPSMAHGANIDDKEDFRPGTKAAEEAGALAPLSDVGLGKEEIRFLSREMGLPTHEKPSAACLASRIPYGNRITVEKLKMVELGEDFLLNAGFENVRVRHHGSLAKVEVSEGDIEKIIDKNLREAIIDRFIELGFDHVAMDMEGYKMGKMNRGLSTF